MKPSPLFSLASQAASIVARNAASDLHKQTSDNPEASAPMNANDVNDGVLEVRALLGRHHALPSDIQLDVGVPQIKRPVAIDHLLDADIGMQMLMEQNPDYALQSEGHEIATRLSELLSKPQILEEYAKMFTNIAKDYGRFLRLQKAYETGVMLVPNVDPAKKPSKLKLDQEARNTVARQMIRLLETFRDQLFDEIQNTHNRVSESKRDYADTDQKSLERLHGWLKECDHGIQQLIASNHEVAIQVRLDQIVSDMHTLRRIPSHDVRKQHQRVGGASYVEVPSRSRMLYGNGSADHYILACLRAGQNVEMLGPTGTGKTQLVMHAASVFAGKKPVVVSGGPGVYRSTFFGSPINLGEWTPGAVGLCLEGDRVLIIDEDNRVDPLQMAEIKLLLGLKAGDTYTHPDTGKVYVIPPHFAVMVTRNELGKHHLDRYDLPPDYRREFSLGSFEIDYYRPEEMYESFFLPKLIESDGSLLLSKEDVGGDADKPGETSPLLSLALVAEKIQGEYKKNNLKNAVLESGYLIGVLDQWKEMRFKQKSDGTQITFLDYLETKLIEFMKRPIGNQDRKIILTQLVQHGFFFGRKYEEFATANDGPMLPQSDFDNLTKGAKRVFKQPTGATLSPREVALLDPFHLRKITVPPHALEAVVSMLLIDYQSLCRSAGIRPLVFSAHTLESKRADIVKSIVDVMKTLKIPNVAMHEANLIAARAKPTADFIKVCTSTITLALKASKK